MDDPVAEFYETNVQQEWDRLARHRTEFAVTMTVLKQYLPAPPARILDVGGGPGRYALSLAHHGYRVTLIDLAATALRFAADKANQLQVTLDGYFQANATDLHAVPDATYDVVLLMGPLYHLLTAAERTAAFRQASAKLKPAGLIAVSFINRYSPLRFAAATAPTMLEEFRDQFAELLAEGVWRKPASFTDIVTFTPHDIPPLMHAHGYEQRALIGCEGLVGMMDQRVNALTGELWERWVTLNVQAAFDPSLHGAADHLLYIGQKPG